MALKNYVDKTGPVVTAAWLNAVDTQTVGNVKNYGAVPTVDCSALVTLDAADNSNIIFPAGAWNIASLPTLPLGAIITTLPGSTFTGAGASLLGLGVASPAAVQLVDYNPAVGQLATFNIFKNPHYNGGTPGFTPATLRIQTNVGANVGDYEWGVLSILNNSATGGQNVAIYGQGNKLTGAGPTWAGVFEVQDKSGVGNPTTGMVAVEIDARASGTDASGLRVGLDLVCSRYPYNSGIAATISYGYRVGSFGDALVTIGRGYSVENTTCNVAFDCSGATIVSAAMRMGAGTAISFDIAGVNQLLYDNVGLKYTVSGNPVFRVNAATGIVNSGIRAFSLTNAHTTSTAIAAAAGTTQASFDAADTLAGTTLTSGYVTDTIILTNIAVTNYRGFEVRSLTLQGGATVANYSGFYITSITPGSSQNVGVNLNLPSGANNFNILCQGTAQNQMNGPLGVNGNTAPSQSTGWGVPINAGVVNNFAGSAATLASTGQAVSQLIIALKAFGLFAA